MFLASTPDMLNALANIVHFAAPRPAKVRRVADLVDPRTSPAVAAVRLRAVQNQLEITAADGYVAGQARVTGTGTDGGFGAVVNASDLKPVIAALKAAKGRGTASLDLTPEGLRVVALGAIFLLPVTDIRFPAVEDLFNIPVHDSPASFTVIDVARLSALSKLRSYNAAGQADTVALLTANTQSRPLLGTFGGNFRFLVMPRHVPGKPPELSTAAGADWATDTR